VLDTPEALFAGLPDQSTLRSELRRLFGWLKDRGVTAVITAEKGEGQITRHGLEEYVSDCVIVLDNRVIDQVTTRRLRVVKYRGSAHGSNEYPFLIDDGGISVLPITTAGLTHASSDLAVSSGIPELDAMLGVGGFYKGSSILVSGTSGTGKTIFASHFADAACERGERCLFFAFEESPEQLLRNTRSVGFDLRRHIDSGMLRFMAARPSLYGLEMHLTLMGREVERFQPDAVIVDPISAFRGPASEVHAMLLRLVDLLKSRGVTAYFTNLTIHDRATDQTDIGLSSLMDTWIGLHDIEANGERNRGLYLLKSRGMGHSNQVREYQLTSHGVRLIAPYLGTGEVLTGTARQNQEARDRADALQAQQDYSRREREYDTKRQATERQIAELRSALEAEAHEIRILGEEAQERAERLVVERESVSRARTFGE
jgi:circadian clock protein KaiC